MDDKARNHIKTFDCHGDQNTLGLRWKRWLTAFELFADGKGLILNEDNENNRQRRRALMLHLAGPDVQDIFLTLPNTGDVKDYRKAVDALNAYFAPKVDTSYARHCFRQLVQAPGETRDYCLVLTLLPNCTSTRSRRHLLGIEGQENISDDIIVHGKEQKEHDLRLEKVIVRLKGTWTDPQCRKVPVWHG